VRFRRWKGKGGRAQERERERERERRREGRGSDLCTLRDALWIVIQLEKTSRVVEQARNPELVEQLHLVLAIIISSSKELAVAKHDPILRPSLGVLFRLEELIPRRFPDRDGVEALFRGELPVVLEDGKRDESGM